MNSRASILCRNVVNKYLASVYISFLLRFWDNIHVSITEKKAIIISSKNSFGENSQYISLFPVVRLMLLLLLWLIKLTRAILTLEGWLWWFMSAPWSWLGGWCWQRGFVRIYSCLFLFFICMLFQHKLCLLLHYHTSPNYNQVICIWCISCNAGRLLFVILKTDFTQLPRLHSFSDQ